MMTNHNTVYPTTYREKHIGRTLYCVTSIYIGEIDLAATLERLAVQRVLADMENERLTMNE